MGRNTVAKLTLQTQWQCNMSRHEHTFEQNSYLEQGRPSKIIKNSHDKNQKNNEEYWIWAAKTWIWPAEIGIWPAHDFTSKHGSSSAIHQMGGHIIWSDQEITPKMSQNNVWFVLVVEKTWSTGALHPRLSWQSCEDSAKVGKLCAKSQWQMPSAALNDDGGEKRKGWGWRWFKT